MLKGDLNKLQVWLKFKAIMVKLAETNIQVLDIEDQLEMCVMHSPDTVACEATMSNPWMMTHSSSCPGTYDTCRSQESRSIYTSVPCSTVQHSGD